MFTTALFSAFRDELQKIASQGALSMSKLALGLGDVGRLAKAPAAAPMAPSVMKGMMAQAAKPVMNPNSSLPASALKKGLSGSARQGYLAFI